MKKVKLWVGWCLEAGDANICHRYWFEIMLSDEEYEELYQVWFDNNSELNSWVSNWDGHDVLFEKLNGAAIHSLCELLKQNEPEFSEPLNVFWEISKETADAF